MRKNNNRTIFRIFLALSILTGSAALFCTFLEPSESGSAFFLGYSAFRWLLGLLTALVLTAFILLLYREVRENGALSAQTEEFLSREERIYPAVASALGTGLLCLWLFQFSWLFVPKNLRPLLLWGAFLGLSAAAALRLAFREQFTRKPLFEKYRILPHRNALDAAQRRTLGLLLLIGLVYIAVLMPSNINGSQDWDAFRHYGGDEYVIYPILQNVMTPGKDFGATLYHHYVHEDYHYGYPFYAWSSFVLLPVRALAGPDFLNRIDLTLPVLRVMVSVIPLMAGCLILVFLTTRFRNPRVSVGTWLFLLTAPGSLQNNQGFWHPDGLNLFFVCAALYFLQRDRQRYGRNFYAAAFFAGLSAATRLYGFFFFLAIGVYLVAALIRKQLDFKQVTLKGLLFILVMFGTILWADPFLFRADARQNMIAILTEKTGEMSSGYNADFSDPKNDYRPGWDAWYPALEDHYTLMPCFFYLLFSLLCACFYGKAQGTYRFLFLWWIVIAVYLIFFVAVKSTQYVLPMMLPLMSCIFTLPQTFSESLGKKGRLALWLPACAFYFPQLAVNLVKIAPRFGL